MTNTLSRMVSPEAVKAVFEEWVIGWGWADSERYIYVFKEYVYDVGGESEWPVSRLLGKLWNCKDSMPDHLCERLNIEKDATFARAAQMILTAGKSGKFFIPLTGYRVPPP